MAEALQYLAGWDVQQGLVMGLCETKTGIEPFGRLVQHVVKRPVCGSADRVFWVVDSSSSAPGRSLGKADKPSVSQRHSGTFAGACELAQSGGSVLFPVAEGRS